MHDVLGGTSEIPIISEYNYDPHIPAFNNDSQFVTLRNGYIRAASSSPL
jgi:hypothetical protein